MLRMGCSPHSPFSQGSLFGAGNAEVSGGRTGAFKSRSGFLASRDKKSNSDMVVSMEQSLVLTGIRMPSRLNKIEGYLLIYFLT